MVEPLSTVVIRPEGPVDADAIRRVVDRAFGRTDEAGLVEALRDEEALAVSLVAEVAAAVVGHVAFSPVVITDDGADIEALCLAPLAVLPSHQNQGIGTRLIEAGLQSCRSTDCGFVVVLGDPEYYGRRGFAATEPFDIRCPYDAPRGAFRVHELRTGALAETRGIVRYHPAFDGI
jgi:putative acetyltransferase